MSTRSLPRPLGYVLAAIVLALSLLTLVGQSLTTVQAARQSLTLHGDSAATTAGSTYVVNSTADAPDADVGNSACADASGHCTLRAAIMQANFVTGLDTITLPSGVYLLTRSGDDDASVLGDLDIVDDLTIQGAGSSVTIVDGNGAAIGDRVFQILPTAKDTSLSGLTIRNGKKITNTFDEGGGLYWDGEGSHLRLHDVVFESNTARYGGGLYLNYSSAGDVVDMDHIIVHANTATTGAAGGLGVSFGDFAAFDLRNSQVYSNTAYEGGGIYFQGTPPFGLLAARIATTEIYSNAASLSAGIENHSGNAAIPIVVLNSHVHNNHADYYGGAIGNYGTLVISNTSLDANSASTAGVYSATTRGGGLYNYEGGQVDIVQSTLSGNLAASGGGIYSELFIHNSAALTLTNSTLSGNIASRDGGGLYANGGQVQLFNATIADNHVLVPLGTFYPGVGGGLYITATAVVTAQNLLLADNTHRNGADLPEPDDCFGLLNSLGFNLIETTTHCTIIGTSTGNVTGQDPVLGPLQNNGGATQTRRLLPGSPAIDAGQTPFCSDDVGAPIATDQRGFRRPIGPRCDIGAVEVGPYVYLPLIQR
jgi:CSLREA domain-containing protein